MQSKEAEEEHCGYGDVHDNYGMRTMIMTKMKMKKEKKNLMIDDDRDDTSSMVTKNAGAENMDAVPG